MCGIAGIVGGDGSPGKREELARLMVGGLAHRGPDGFAFFAERECAFGFCRLAIIDPEAPATAFANETGTVRSVANAEIYNAPELRARLAERGHRLRSQVDTEVLPHLYEEHGVDLVPLLDGMFALAIWDARARRLLLARDRAGEKPLFYWLGDGEIAFASELGALLRHPEVSPAVDPVALRRYLLHDFFPAPHTPIASIRKLPAGHYLDFRDGAATVHRYWDLADSFGRRGDVDLRSVADEVDAAISDAVRRRSMSDLPVGVFLSGGIDSSTVLAHLAEQQGPGVPVFSLGHRDPDFDETSAARRTAEHFGADFHELILDDQDLAEGLRLVGEGFDEPLGDASTLPTHLLARFARQRVKVVLSGEGADELFAGYPTYLGHRVAAALSPLPPFLRSSLLRGVSRLLPSRMGNVSLGYLLERFVSGVAMPLVERHHTWFGSLAPAQHSAVLSQAVLDRLGDDDPFGSAKDRLASKAFPDDLSRVLYTDFTMYLQDGLLTKVDRATMLASLEARAPFLDTRLAELVASLPSSLKLRGMTTKLVLRKACQRRLPKEILGRRKRGFNIPFSRWILEGLSQELTERFSTERVLARGLFRPEGIHQLLDEHASQQRNHRKPLFTLLAFDLWCDRVFGVGAAVPLATAVAATAAADAPAPATGEQRVAEPAAAAG